MKYQEQLQEVQRIFPTVQNIVIALPANPSVDHLAAGLALFLSLQQVQRSCSIASDGPILVGHTNLFGVGQIQNKLPQASGGDYVLTLTGVANPSDPDRPIPSVEKMDYKTEGTDLKLIFKVLPGQKFEPQAIVPSSMGGSLELVFVIGTSSLAGLGNIYNQNQGAFNGAHVVNIDNQPNNSQFGSTNVVDPAASSLSEMIGHLLPTLTLPVEGDVATNLISGIFHATSGLQSGNVNADTFLVVAEAMRAGGQRPQSQAVTSTQLPVVPAQQDQASETAQELHQIPADQAAIGQAFAQAFAPTGGGNPEQPSESQPAPEPAQEEQQQSSPEEKPAGEGVTMEGEAVNPEPDWLTPKIFRGGIG